MLAMGLAFAQMAWLPGVVGSIPIPEVIRNLTFFPVGISGVNRSHEMPTLTDLSTLPTAKKSAIL
jgi:hypothetical protein